jgi:hypothetical protein
LDLTCPHCRQTIQLSGPTPSFCPFCGRPFEAAPSTLAATAVFVPDTEARAAETQVGTAFPARGNDAASDGATVGEYRLLRRLGQGGMGAVWLAEHCRNGRRVALKLLAARLQQTPETVERFLREARLAASLSHPRSTFVYGAGFHDHQPYIVMELMPGDSLKDVVDRQGPLPTAKAVDHILDAIEGLLAAHAVGIVHRDVKPSNCFLDSDGRVKIGDFGLSRSLSGEVSLTRTGAFLGTPQFAAPEQVRGEPVDERTDVYSVGATLFSLLANRGPYVGDAAAVIAQIASDPAPPLHTVAPSVPKPLSRVVGRALEKDPAQRHATLGQFRDALLPFASGGTSIADVGRRVAAYTLDSMFTVTLGVIALFVVMAARGIAIGTPAQATTVPDVFQAQLRLQCWIQLGTWAATAGYFALCEGLWGCGLGKLMLGLRVVDLQGQRPRLWRTVVRSALVPAGLGLGALGPIWQLFTLETPAEAIELANPSWMGSHTLVALAGWLFVLACLLTMRARNSYRGLHEWASGTRTIRLRAATATRRLRVPVVAPRHVADSLRFGPFEVTGLLGERHAGCTYQAHDALLSRAVWVRTGTVESLPGGAARLRIARPTRPHWLQGGESPEAGSRPWNAFEAVTGAPLGTAAVFSAALEWEQGRRLLRDLAAELAAAEAEGTLPVGVGLEHVWVDRGGRVKLLDEPPTPNDKPESEVPVATVPLDRAARAVQLLRSAAELLSRGRTLPGHAHDFLRELTGRPDDGATLAWAAEQLRAQADRPATLRWDDRLGVLCVSMGTEFNAVTLACGAAGWLAAQFDSIALPVWMFLAPLAALALPVAATYAFRGGPVFRLVGIEVRRRDGAPAGRWRCAWRGLLAWGGFVWFYTLIAWIGVKAMSSVSQPTADGAAGPLLTFTQDQMWWALPSICCSESLILASAAGLLVAVLSPSRGLQDFLAGTRLVPK